ncbi:hypothetical protein QM806_04250 [Rhodococcus sp. IEGM 1351]|uniref:hypothetical protein n=1 Tax=Rhodococcus sp. IEGM 1351 TaxID=3047089 RepID=UPI0024B822FE|nr:hypothetical protein [Rhodococcus sp. IEGM 1351]MDI9934665.1 hypothetical protein [Rhodococcus sp. IEGM 1351]
MSSIERWKGKEAEVSPTSFIEAYVGRLDVEEEIDGFEAVATKRNMGRTIDIYNEGAAKAGNDQGAQQIVIAYVSKYAELVTERQRRRMLGG